MSDDSFEDGEHSYAAFVDALEDGDAERALQIGAELTETPEDRLTLLERFIDAVERGEDQRAETVFRSYMSQVERQRAERRATLDRATAARNQSGDRDERARLQEYMQTESAAGTQQTELAMLASKLFAERRRGDDGQVPGELRPAVVDAARRQLDRERAVKGGRETVESITETTEVPPTLSVVDVADTPLSVDAGDAVSTAVTVENIGDSEATGVRVSGASDSDLSVSVAGDDLGTVAAGSSRTVDVSVQAGTAGERTASVVVESDNAERVREQFSVSVVADAGSGLAARFDDGDGIIDAREVLQVIEAYNDDGSDLVVQDVLRVITEYNAEQQWENVSG
jgi:hypothetical protein